MGDTQFREWLLLLFCSMLIGGFCYYFFSERYHSRKAKKRVRHGLAMEKSAVGFLKRHGYRIVASQLEEEITVFVDGEALTSKVRADFLVKKGFKTYIVEVKSGEQGTVRRPNVRRQLLEYKLVFEPDGILLLDMEERNLQEICFSYKDKKQKTGLVYMFGLFTGILLFIILQLW